MIYYNVKFRILKDKQSKLNFFLVSGPLGSVQFQILENNFSKFELKSSLNDSYQSNYKSYQLNELGFILWVSTLNLSKKELSLLKKKIINIIKFVCFGNFAYLKLVGIGYKVEKMDQNLNLNLGYSHKINLEIPQNIKVFIPKGFKDQKLTLFGLDLESVILFRSQIRELYKPEVYKGKGIRFEDEIILLKENKKSN